MHVLFLNVSKNESVLSPGEHAWIAIPMRSLGTARSKVARCLCYGPRSQWGCAEQSEPPPTQRIRRRRGASSSPAPIVQVDQECRAGIFDGLVWAPVFSGAPRTAK